MTSETERVIRVKKPHKKFHHQQMSAIKENTIKEEEGSNIENGKNNPKGENMAWKVNEAHIKWLEHVQKQLEMGEWWNSVSYLGICIKIKLVTIKGKNFNRAD